MARFVPGYGLTSSFVRVEGFLKNSWGNGIQGLGQRTDHTTLLYCHFKYSAFSVWTRGILEFMASADQSIVGRRKNSNKKSSVSRLELEEFG